MNNKSLSKIYNVKYMDYPDFLIHIFKVLSSIFIELMCKRIKFVIIVFFLKAFNGWLFSLCNGPFYIIFLCYIIYYIYNIYWIVLKYSYTNQVSRGFVKLDDNFVRTENRANCVKGEDNACMLHNIVLINDIIDFLWNKRMLSRQ